MQYKIYLRTKSQSIDEQIKLYEKAFNAKVIKKGFWKEIHFKNNEIKEEEIGKVNFAYLYLLENKNLKLLIAKHRENMPKFGFSINIVISFEKNYELFDSVYNNLLNIPEFKLIYPKKKQHWNTTIASFLDKYNFSWILELDERK